MWSSNDIGYGLNKMSLQRLLWFTAHRQQSVDTHMLWWILTSGEGKEDLYSNITEITTWVVVTWQTRQWNAQRRKWQHQFDPCHPAKNKIWHRMIQHVFFCFFFTLQGYKYTKNIFIWVLFCFFVFLNKVFHL